MQKSGNNDGHPVRVGLISLGCAKNLVDAEIMLGSLLKSGVEITNDAAQADVVIVNTCSFINSAQEESVDTILQSAELREAKNRGQALVVSGCLPQRFRDELPKLLPEVDAFMGIDEVTRVAEIVGQAWARRRARLQSREATAQDPKSKIQASKQRVVSKIAALGKDGPHHEPPPLPTPRQRDHPLPRRQQERGQGARELPGSGSDSLQVNPRPVYIPDFATPRFRLTPRHFAYVKIAEGCNHPCSFCIIPRMRGSHRSRPQADIVREAKQLLADGVRELNLISQDSTYYGLDLRPNHSRNIASPEKFNSAARALKADATTLCTLLRELNALPGDFWVRLLYTHPAHWTDELIRTMAECPKVARYVDMPLQHIHDVMLERMRRETSRSYIEELLARIRAGISGIALRTTFIVGFPGETEEYFESLLDFIRAARFERLGVFLYSREEGTRAGGMRGQIPERTKQQRRSRAMAAQQEIAREVAAAFVGRELNVLVEGAASAKQLQAANVSSWEHGWLREPDSGRRAPRRVNFGKMLVARGEADAPDIDGRVYVRGFLPTGAFARVKIVGHTDYDLMAEAAKDGD